MKKPNFFIIGGPKCGTTSLSVYLSEHPDVLFTDHPKVFEPEYFSSDLSENGRNSMSIDEYLSCWTGDMDQYIAVGEKSVKYILSKVAVQNILSFNPEAKFILMVRNPIELVDSLHAQLLCFSYEDVADLEQAWGLQASRERGENIPSHCLTPLYLQYGKTAKLGEQLERLYKQVSREKVKVILFDDFRSKTEEVYQEVLDFLCLSPCSLNDYPVMNPNSKTRSALLYRMLIRIGEFRKAIGIKYSFGFLAYLHRINNKVEMRQSIGERFRCELSDYFREDVEKLSSFIGRDLSYWLEKPK